jgi:hypothetical protein
MTLFKINDSKCIQIQLNKVMVKIALNFTLFCKLQESINERKYQR